MQVYVIHPGAPWATHDVYTGLVAGLRAAGMDVVEGRLDTIFTWYEAAWQGGIAQGFFQKPAQDDGRAPRWASAHITQHILETWPDLVIAVSGGNYHTKDVDSLRRCGMRTAVLLTESPYFLDAERQIAAHYDVAFTNERAAVAALRQAQPQTHYIPHAYHPAVHTAAIPPDPAKASDVCFIGSIFEERRELFQGVDWSGIRCLMRGYDLVTETRSLVSNMDAVEYYRSTKINLNPHRTTTSHGSGQHITTGEAESLNPRAYELAACGVFQLMDDSRPERFDVFGDAMPTFRTGDSADLERCMRYWLQHDDRRESIARDLHAAVQPHSWTQRAARMLEVIDGAR